MLENETRNFCTGFILMRFVESYTAIVKTLEAIISESRRDEKDKREQAEGLLERMTCKSFVHKLCGKLTAPQSI